MNEEDARMLAAVYARNDDEKWLRGVNAAVNFLLSANDREEFCRLIREEEEKLRVSGV